MAVEPTPTRTIGARAEARIADYLERRDLRILARNWSCRGGELDLVCLDRETIVFVEVRARRDARHGSPLETVDPRKRQRLLHAARLYLSTHGLWGRPCRFDVAGITGDTIDYVEDAFSEG